MGDGIMLGAGLDGGWGVPGRLSGLGERACHISVSGRAKFTNLIIKIPLPLSRETSRVNYRREHIRINFYPILE